jgi:hypothetical protein
LIAQKATGNRGLFVCAIKKPFSMSGNALPKYFFLVIPAKAGMTASRS